MNSSFTLRMDDDLKKEFEQVVNGMGLTMTAAFTAFAKATVSQGQIPFPMSYNPLGNPEFRAYVNQKLDEGERRAQEPGAKRYGEDEFWKKHGL